MAAAIFGLIGVLLGGLVTAWTQWRLEAHREKRDAEAFERQAKVSLRLVRDEIDTIRLSCGAFVQLGARPKQFDPDYYFPHEEWDRHKETLAAAITDDELWRWVVNAYFNARSLRTTFDATAPGDPLNEDQIGMLKQAFGDAAEVLEELA